MPDYRRLISYIYEYEGKEKGKNVGFVKIEARNGTCRMNVNVKRMYVGGNAIGVYLLGKEGQKTFLGNMFARNGNGEFRTAVDIENVEGTGNGLDTYYGLTVHDVKNSWRSYKTIWEDAVMPEENTVHVGAGLMAAEVLPGSTAPDVEELALGVAKEMEAELGELDPIESTGEVEYVEPVEETESTEHVESLEETESTEHVESLEETESTEQVELVEETEPTERVRPVEAVESTEYAEPMEPIRFSEPANAEREVRTTDQLIEDDVPMIQEHERTDQPDHSSSKDSSSALSTISPELENPDVLQYLQETENKMSDPETLWQELRKSYPKISPFDYESGCEVLTIRPEDIGRLPRENWVYGNNSFLLHGYYNFRYLILVRLNHQSDAPRFLIGIPGHYYSSEKYMATMFGFPNFVLSKKQPPNDGRFGYWYTDIKMR